MSYISSKIEAPVAATGEVAWFSPLQALVLLPSLFFNGDAAALLKDNYFSEEKLFSRRWDLYYRWPAEREDPLIYVTKTSLLLYLLEIDAAVPEDISVRLSWCMRGRSIVVDFPDKAPYRPVALGRCTSREEYLDCISRAVKEESSTPSPQDGLVMDDLRLNHDAIIGPQKVLGTEKDMELDRKSLRRDKNVERTARKLKRAERYLGLRQKRVKVLAPTYMADTPWEEVDALVDVHLAQFKVLPIDDQAKAPYPFERGVVFIAFDIEMYERNHRQITEIGIATLDTNSLKDIPPGQNGRGWQAAIKAQHIRIQEYAHLVNGRYVKGNPDKFEFGKSEFVSMKAIKYHLAQCFQPPSQVQDAGATDSAPVEVPARNIILVGHDIRSDVDGLQRLGFDPLKIPGLVEVLDTSILDKALTKNGQNRALGKILYEYDLSTWNLHNAGNDAVYTMWLLLALAVEHARSRGKADQVQHDESDDGGPPERS